MSKKIGIFLLTMAIMMLSNCTTTPDPRLSLTPSTEETGFVVTIPKRGYMRSKTTVSAEAPAGTGCELIFITPDGVDSQEQGLGKTTAAKNGLCTWNFVIEHSERKGSARLLIYIDGVGETHFMEIRRAYYPY